MITKLNFDNLSPFRKMANKVGNSGSKTQREADSENRNTVLKSARGLPDGRQFQGYNVQNILNSSTRINSMPSNITPKKTRNAQQLSSSQNQAQQQQQQYNNSQEFIQSNLYCKTQENISPQSSHIQNSQQNQQGQQSFSKNSPMVVRQSLQKEKHQQNTSQSQTQPTMFNHQNLNQSISGLNTIFNNLNNSNQVLNNLTNNTNNMSQVNNNNMSCNNNANNTVNSSNNGLNQQYNQQEKVGQDEIKRLKSEIESFKSREIKHLVKIASMEKENKRIQELQQKLEYENKMLKNELNNFSKHKRSNTALSGRRNEEGGLSNNISNNQQTQGLQHNNLQQSQHNLQQGQQPSQQFQQQTIQKLDKCVQVQTTNKNEQQIAILEEYTRLLRKKLKDIEQNQKQQNNSMLIIGNNNTNVNESSSDMINIKNNYDFLKQKYKEVLERLYYIQKEGYEMKMESGFLKKFLKEKYSSFHSRSTNQSCETNRNGLIQQASYKLLVPSSSNKYTSQNETDIAPSVVRALNLPSIIK